MGKFLFLVFLIFFGLTLTTMAADSPTTRTKPITVAVIDSGIDSANPNVLNPIVAAKSFTGRNCLDDRVGHGTHIATLYNNVRVQLLCIQVIDVNDGDHSASADKSGWGTPEDLLSGLDYVSTMIDTLNIRVVNISLVGYPETPELTIAIKKLEEGGAIVVMAAGNENSRITSPCRIAYTMRGGICVIGANEDGTKWEKSNWGYEGDIANCCGATSWAAANTGYLTAWLMSLLPPESKPLPAFFKKVIVLGADHSRALAGFVGDPDRGLDGRIANITGARLALERLQNLRLISYSPVGIVVGSNVTIATSEDPQWLANFFPAFDKLAVPKFSLTDDTGNSTIVEGTFYGGELWFRVPAQGDYSIQLVIEGLPVGDKMPIHVSP